MSRSIDSGYRALVAQSPPWPVQMAADIGRRVAAYRAKATDASGRRMTVQALADRCAELGLPLDRTVITKLEKGRRQSITVPELLVLARALEVAPLLLLFPVGTEDTIEVVPDVVIPPFRAALWFTGEQPWPDGTDDAARAWWRGSFAAVAFREHEKLAEQHRLEIRAARMQRQTLVEATMADDKAQDLRQSADFHERAAAEIERQLRAVRRAMRDRKLDPPPLAGGLEHIDGPGGDENVPGFVLAASFGLYDDLGGGMQ